MSLTLALQNAVSGLRVNQSALSVLSNNIANSSTPDYSREIINQQSVYLNNVGAGAEIAEITRNVDRYLQGAVRMQTSIVGASSVNSDYMEKLQVAMGTPTSGSTLNGRIDSFFSAMQQLADNPALVSVRQSALSAAQQLALNINNLSSTIYALRFQADQDISNGVKSVNQNLSDLYNVNSAINTATAFHQTTTGLLDKRDALVKKIAEYCDVTVSYSENGKVTLFTNGGIPLIDDQLHQIRYSPLQSVESLENGAVADQIKVIAVDPLTGKQIGTNEQVLVDSSTIGTVNTAMKTGKFLGLLQVRDVNLPAFGSSLDELAAKLRDQVNTIHNQGTGFPPPSTLTGQTYLDPNEVRSWNGGFMMAVLNKDGTPLTNQYNTTPPGNTEIGGMRPLKLNFGFDSGEGQVGLHSNQTIIDEINAYFGTPQTETHLNNLNDIKLVSMFENNPASLNFKFDLDLSNISSDDAQVQITGLAVTNGVAGAVPAGFVDIAAGERTRTGADYSFDVTSTGGVMFVDVDVQVTNPTTGSVQTSTLRFTVDPAMTDIRNDRYSATSVLAGTATQDAPINANPIASASIVDADGNPVAPGESGYLKIETNSTDYGISIDEMNSSDNGKLFDTPPVVGTGWGFSHFFGLNNLFNENRPSPDTTIDNIADMTPNSALNLSVRSDIAANANLLSAGIMQRSAQSPDPSLSPTYTYELGAGSKTIAQKLADLANQSVAFDSSGALTSTSNTLTSFASSFLGAAASSADSAKQTLTNDQTILDGYTQKNSAISGVNLDEEMGNTIVYQNSYTASARIVTVVDKMLQTLLDAV